MPLQKIVLIKNVGRFSNYSASGDVSLKRYTLVFGENGRGKTTLCDILRSARNGDAAPVNGRRTLGGASAPEINLRTDRGTVTFTAGAWSDTLPEITIFDSTFISQNVHSGDLVDLNHRRNLYRVIIGKDGVDLARAVDELDADIKTRTGDIRDKRAVVQSHAPHGMNVEIFSTLEADSDIEAKIAAKVMELEAVRQADQLRARAGLSELTLPVVPANLEALLTTTIEGLAADAARRVAAQIEEHGMHARGETWLSEGLRYVRNGACPFCGEPVVGSALIEAYSAYFSAAYNDLRREIGALKTNIENTFGDRAIAQVERTIDANQAISEFWARYVEIISPAITAGVPVSDVLRGFRDAALQLIEMKSSAAIERIVPDQRYTNAVAASATAQKAANEYNAEVRTANATIEAKKAITGSVDVSVVENALRQLQAVKLRHQPRAVAACLAHDTAIAEKRTKEEEKATARLQLDQYTSQVIGRYEKTINDLLDDFQAGFRIAGTRHTYPGGVPSSSFQIVINDTRIDLGDESTPLDQPSFRNTLSAGDKSTLALAFFLAELEHDRDKTTRIVVFDDPFNSQDAFRKDHTVEKIRKCGDGCAQVIVLSHDQGFLKRVWDRLAPQASHRKCLQLARIGVRNTALAEWDIEKATQQRFKADLKALAEYYNAGEKDPRDIVSKLRPVLETYCRNLYPSQFLETDMLGTIITKIRQAGPTHDFASEIDDIEAINIYTRRYHHGESAQPATEEINDTELQGFVMKTLAITGYS